MTTRHTAHMKRIAAPRRYDIGRKESKYLIKSSPGPHKKEDSLPLVVMLRDSLKVIRTSSEAVKILNERKVLIDQKARTDKAFPVGLMDVISIPAINANYRVVFGKYGIIKPIQINEHEAKLKLCKILNKTKNKKGIYQINLHDGRNILIKEDIYKTGDSLLISLPDHKIQKHIKLEKGVYVYITDGKHVGETAEVIEFKPQPGSQSDRILLKNEKGEIFETLGDYAFVSGKEKQELKMKGD